MKKYAIVTVFGKQYKVSEGDVIQANYVDSPVGTVLPFDHVLMVHSGSDVKVGAPLVAGAKVNTKVVEHIRDDKVIVFKYLRKNKSKKMQGHRQPYTMLSVTGIEG
jgi:large subunit ribosomal protein L21